MSNEGFLSRWSRRKIETQEDLAVETPPVEVVADEATAPVTVVEEPELAPEEQEAIIADLPDIESLTAESDFSAFMQRGVPEELQKLALRKLWKSNPVFANLDGLNDYDEDFSIITPLAEGVAEQLQKLMKENSAQAPDPEEDEATEEVVEDAPDDLDEEDDQDVGDAEDDF